MKRSHWPQVKHVSEMDPGERGYEMKQRSEFTKCMQKLKESVIYVLGVKKQKHQKNPQNKTL